MKSNPSIHPRPKQLILNKFFLSGLILLFIACDLASSAAQPTQTPFVITATSPSTTETPLTPPTSTVEPTIAITATDSPSCTVLQDVNLRNGPGTAYNPPLGVLKAGVKFTPIGFNPQGVPGGPWVQGQVASTNQTGWVSAGEQYVSCNLDLATLPRVDVAPPPKAAPPKIISGDPDGNNIDPFRSAFDYDPDTFVRMYVFRSDDQNEEFSFNKDGRGITSVNFRVTTPDESRTFYERRENNAGYCIFGGGEPDCNPWVYENGQHKWSSGGEVVEERDYKLIITVTAEDGEVGEWLIPINLNLQ